MKSERGFWADVLAAWYKNLKLFAKAELKLIGLIYILLLLGLNLIGYEMAWLIALGISLLDLLPVIGSGMVFIPWVLIEWLGGSTENAFWLLILYLVIALAKQLIEPFFLGKDLQLPFWLPIVILLISTLLFNVFGIIVSSLLIPLVAAYRQVSAVYHINK